MAVYKFRVTFEDHDDVYRDIEIRSTQTFEELHHAILRAISFDSLQSASFYMSDDNWKKGQEIVSNEKEHHGKNGSDKKLPVMKKSRLCDFIVDPHQKIYYIYDYKALWSFYVELFKILQDEKGVAYPRVVKTIGDAPKQHGVSNLGKASADFDFFEERGIDMGEDGDDEGLGIHDEEETTDAEGEEGEEMGEFGAAEEDHHDDH